jgi:hypothetical protein
MNNDVIFCPVCGSSFTIHNNTFTNKKAQERIDALKAAGIDTSTLLAVRSANGEDTIIDANLQIEVNEHTPLFSVIEAQGDIKNPRLFRRWVMAQMFRMLAHNKTYSQAMKKLGYEYQWKMTINELNAQAHMEGRDPVNFCLRNRWFNKSIADSLCRHYIELFTNRVKTTETFAVMYGESAIGTEVKVYRINGKRVNEAAFNDTIASLNDLADKVNASTSARELHEAMVKFNAARPIKFKGKDCQEQCSDWMDAFKGAGAYFTLQNLVRFHDCMIINNGETLDKKASLVYLMQLSESDAAGWWVLGLLKRTLKANNVDVRAKINSWRKQQ